MQFLVRCMRDEREWTAFVCVVAIIAILTVLNERRLRRKKRKEKGANAPVEEGKVKKGGQNERPDGPPPEPPKGQRGVEMRHHRSSGKWTHTYFPHLNFHMVCPGMKKWNVTIEVVEEVYAATPEMALQMATLKPADMFIVSSVASGEEVEYVERGNKPPAYCMRVIVKPG